MLRTQLRRLLFSIAIGVMISYPALVIAEERTATFNLIQTIESALKANLGLKRSKEEVNAALATKKARTTNFLPTFSARYGYIHRDQATNQALIGQGGQSTNVIINPEDEYNFVTSFSQPIFTGFALINQYKIASLGLDVAEISEKLTRQDVILDAKNAYFSILKSQKLMAVAEDTVKQVSAQNNLEISKSQFNTLLRRPVNAPVAIVDILDYTPFEHDINYCLTQADENRLELQVADLEVQIADKDYELSKNNYFPSIDLTGNWSRRGTQWDVDGGEGIADKKFWDIRATATWDFWQWGRTRYGVKEKLRITEERYKEKVSTTTDVLVAQTLLTETMTNYYNSLYDFKIAKAVLYRAMGQEILQ